MRAVPGADVSGADLEHFGAQSRARMSGQALY